MKSGCSRSIRSSCLRSRDECSQSHSSSRVRSRSPDVAKADRLFILGLIEMRLHRVGGRSLLLILWRFFSWIRDICSLPPVPSEWRKICSFCADRDLDDQPSASYCLPVGDVSADILAGIDDHIFSSSFGMQPKKVS